MAAMALSFSGMTDGMLDVSGGENSLLDRIDELDTYNQQMSRLGEVRLLQLRHAKEQLLQKRRRAASDEGEVSVVDFSCRTPSASSTAPAPVQACSPSKASERSGESMDTTTAATILAKNRELSSELAAKVREAERYKQQLVLQQVQQNYAPPKIQKEVPQAKPVSAPAREQVLVQACSKASEDAAATLRGAARVPAQLQARGPPAASSPLKRLTEEAAMAREEARRSCKDELLSWASHLEARAEDFFATELKTAAALTKEEAKASQEALRQSLALELKEEMAAASDAIQERAQLRVFAARKECRSELRMLRQEQEAAMNLATDEQCAEMAFQTKVQGTEQAMKQAAQQEHARLRQIKEGEQQLATARAKLDEEQQQLRRMREVSETQLATTTSQLEDAASQLSRLEAAQQRTREEMAAHHSAAASAWNRSLASAQAARAQAESVLKAASKTWESCHATGPQQKHPLPRLTAAASQTDASSDMLELDDVAHEVEKFLNYRPADVKDFVHDELPSASVQLLSTTTSFESDGGAATDSGGSSSMPLVYAAALEGIETHGWSAVYPLDDPPAWTILHWAAMEGRLEICRRLLAAGADPFCEDERGWTPLDCAEEAGEAEVCNLLLHHGSSADAQDALHPVLAAAVTAVENYGWQAVHEGRCEWTALHWAASEGNKALCARLLLHDADPTQVDQAGHSALDYARDAGHRMTFELLWQAKQRRLRPAASAPPAKQELEPSALPLHGAYPQSLLLPPGHS
ncbi:ANKRD52 [Symbiodinium natans]|uniref:ANKRD52 protein n=1 Tax=Symbiodinium natans TaxID=878477 RepID=A0A812SI73_9DINO|nr:ANKRD52 [Symbiodinium natans]